MLHYTKSQINELDHLYKINLVNCLSGYKSANLIGTKGENGVENVAVFSSVTHIGSEPPLLGLIFRPNSVPRNTYDNIKQTGCFTINHIHQNIIEDAHHTSAKYPKNVSEFDFTELESEYKSDFQAPFVKNSPVQIGLTYKEEYFIKANETILLIGEVNNVYIAPKILDKDGFIDLSEAKVVAINGLYGYSVPGSIKQLDYQRPKKNYELTY